MARIAASAATSSLLGKHVLLVACFQGRCCHFEYHAGSGRPTPRRSMELTIVSTLPTLWETCRSLTWPNRIVLLFGSHFGPWAYCRTRSRRKSSLELFKGLWLRWAKDALYLVVSVEDLPDRYRQDGQYDRGGDEDRFEQSGDGCTRIRGVLLIAYGDDRW